jgi:hypothetical protein
MSRKTSLFGILLIAVLIVSAQSQPMPQTARQALIEMFFGKAAGTFEKHLPEVTVAAMHKATPGSTASMIAGFSALSSQMQTHGQFQTFEAGSTLLTTEDPQTHSKLEVLVARDNLRGETDEIELSFKAYKDGESQTAGVIPRLIFAMQQEQGIWRLHNITLSVGISLTDPTFLKALITPMRPAVVTTSTSAAPLSTNAAPSFSAIPGNEASAVAAIRTINTAEITYAAMYPAHGFACALSDLGGMGGGNNPDEHHALLIDPRLANGRKSGYVFRVSNCSGNPASSYSVTAAPADVTSGTRAFCSDQSAVIHFSPDGNPASCLSAGQSLQ